MVSGSTFTYIRVAQNAAVRTQRPKRDNLAWRPGGLAAESLVCDQRLTRGLSKRPRGTSAQTQSGSDGFLEQVLITSIALP